MTGPTNAWIENEGFSTLDIKWKFEAHAIGLKLVLKRIVTCNETWIQHYDPESKQQSMQWKHASSASHWEFKLQASAGKKICTIFWDAEGELLIDFMPHKVTVIQGFIRLTYFIHCAYQLQESLANTKVNARQHCVGLSLSCLYDHFLVWRPISPEPLQISFCINLISLETTFTGLHFRCWQYGCNCIQIFVVGSERQACNVIECIMAVQGHPTSLIFTPIESSLSTSY